MSCPYQYNSFCVKLSPQTRQSLCARCHFRKYARNQWLNYRYFENAVAVLLDGIMVFGDRDPQNSGKFVTSGLTSSGGLLSPGQMYPDNWKEPSCDRDIFCPFECTVAFFDNDVALSLFDRDIIFVKTVYENIIDHCCHEKQRFFSGVGGRDAYSAVRYVVDYCRRKGIPPLTHEQIALICNRSRPTVTETMHLLLRQEPELFRPLLEPDVRSAQTK